MFGCQLAPGAGAEILVGNRRSSPLNFQRPALGTGQRHRIGRPSAAHPAPACPPTPNTTEGTVLLGVSQTPRSVPSHRDRTECQDRNKAATVPRCKPWDDRATSPPIYTVSTLHSPNSRRSSGSVHARNEGETAKGVDTPDRKRQPQDRRSVCRRLLAVWVRCAPLSFSLSLFTQSPVLTWSQHRLQALPMGE